MPKVNNLFPTISSHLRIAIIGESPGKDEVYFGQPFIGSSGRFLAALLSRAGTSREACYLGNICQYQPVANDISTLSWSGDEIQEGLFQLKQDISVFKPNIIVLLGNTALKAAKDCSTVHPLKPKAFKFKNANWRGSLFIANSNGPFDGYKCIASYHPAYCLRDYETTPLLQFDLRKAVREGTSPLLKLPSRRLEVNLPPEIQIARLREIRNKNSLVALDIEGGIDTMSCISFASSPEDAFIIPINAQTPVEVWRELALTLEDPYVPKVLQNSLYDRFVLAFSYGINVRGVQHDTMLAHWELYSELEKSLGVQASIYTDEPYYKFERKADDNETFYRYCCKDSAVTLEIMGKLDGYLRDSSLEHYRLNVKLLNPILYMELRGIRYDVTGAQQRRALLLNKQFECQARFNALTGHGFSFNSLHEIQQRAKDLMLVKKGDRPYADKVKSWTRYNEILESLYPNLATVGELEDLCEVSLNVDSAKQFIPYLYETLNLPEQRKEDRNNPNPPLTADYEALLKLSRWCQQNGKTRELQIVQAAIEIRALSTRAQMLSISADRDSRIRCGYNLVGSNTGRVTCYESPTGSGYNLQTIPNYTETKEAPGGVLGDRDLFLADEDYWIGQLDGAGADGWTVAAYCKMLGDSTMLQDYEAGISPFKILTLMLRGIKPSDDRKELKEQVKVIDKDAWDRFACKRVQHGASYLEGGLTISRNILKDSEGKLYMTPTECDKLKRYFMTRYWGVEKWHGWVARRIKERPILVAASGQVRQFFGRPEDILTKAVAFEPQANTTYATNLAVWRLWSDNENRIRNISNGSRDCSSRQLQEGPSLVPSSQESLPRFPRVCLKVEPLHQVHDAFIFQFPKTDTDWAVSKLKQWVINPLTIAGQQITIPFEGGYGPNWQTQTYKI